MSQGIYIALSGAKLQQRRLELLSNNLANANTAGYKTDNISAASFEITLEEYMSDDDNFKNLTYTKTGQVSTDFSKGAMKNTGSPLNLALDGPGFLPFYPMLAIFIPLHLIHQKSIEFRGSI